MNTNLLKSVLALFVTALLFTACSKVSDATGGLLGAGQCEVKASFSGATSGSYISNNLTSTVAKNGLMAMFNSSSISPVKMFTIMLPANVKTGTYNLKNNEALGGISFTYVPGTSGQGWSASSNNDDDFIYSITKATSTEIEGTFSGNMHNDTDNTTVKVTNGSFKAKF